MITARSVFLDDIAACLKNDPTFYVAALTVLSGEVTAETSRAEIAQVIYAHLPDMGLDILDGSRAVVHVIKDIERNIKCGMSRV